MSDEDLPSSYPYVPLPDRKPLRFPNGAQLALILTINLEYWEKSRPGQKEPLFTGGPMTLPHALCFGQLYAEGAETGRIMNLGLHPHVIGQAHRIGALREFVEYANSRQRVWFATREEIANWYLEIHQSHIPDRRPRDP